MNSFAKLAYPRRDVGEGDAAEIKVRVRPVEFKAEHSRDAAAPRLGIAQKHQAFGANKIWHWADTLELKRLPVFAREAEMGVPDVGRAVEIGRVANGAGIQPWRR